MVPLHCMICGGTVAVVEVVECVGDGQWVAITTRKQTAYVRG